MVARKMVLAQASYKAHYRGARADEISGNGVNMVPRDVANISPKENTFALQRL